MDVGLALFVVPVIVGLVALAVRLGCPSTAETPFAIALGIVISVGFTIAATVPGGVEIATSLLRGVALGLSAASVIATVRRLTTDSHARRRPRSSSGR